MLASYEHDFKDHVKLLQEIIDDADPASRLDKNSFALENAQKLLKQMEVEAMNFMEDDTVRRRVSNQLLSWGNLVVNDKEKHFELILFFFF